MITGSANRRKSILYIVSTMLMCLICLLALSACNPADKNVKVSERSQSVYFGGVTYAEDEGVIYVTVTMSGKDENKLDESLNWVSTSYAKNTWYNVEDVEISFNPSALYADATEFVEPEQYVHEGKEYKLLKVVLRYDTIYKSIHSNASVTKQGNRYLHRFEFDESEDVQSLLLTRQSQNSASMYSVLIASVIIFAVILVGVWLAIKGKLWQKKTKRNE